LLLLDVMMPGMSGFELARLLKEDEETGHIPIIFLTAKDTEDDTLQGFSLGADDYVTKPFSVREVMARVKAVLNRKSSPKEDHLRFEGLVVNAANKTICIDGAPMALTRTEYELLHLLLSHRGQVFSRQQLLDNVWPQDVIVTERTVDVNMARLRKKLGCYAACLVSRTGFGYAFEVNSKK
jgi:DNA-binding response OmpR family regulator